MSIWNKVLLGFIFLTAFACIFLGYRHMKTQNYWRTAITKQDDALIRTVEEADRLYNGVESDGEVTEEGVRQLKRELHMIMFQSGQKWRNCTPSPVQGNGASLTVTVTTDGPNTISPGTILQVFDDIPMLPKPDAESEDDMGGMMGMDDSSTAEETTPAPIDNLPPGNYLGMFKAESTTPQQVILTPVGLMSPEEVAILTKSAQSSRPWVLMGTMPEAFAGMTKEEIDLAFPPIAFPEIANSESMTPEALQAAAQPLIEASTDQYVAELGARVDAPLDFELYLTEMRRIRTLMQQQQMALSEEVQAMEEANRLSKEQETHRQDEITRLKQEIVDKQTEVTDAKGHRQALEDRITGLQSKVDSMMKENQRLASEIAKAQFQMIETTDEASSELQESRQ